MTDEPVDAANVNEQVTAQWVAETTPFERVRAVTRRAYEPQSAAQVADRARTSETTARKHLEQLVESGYLAAVARPETDATRYERSSSSLVLEEASAIRRDVDRETLLERITDLQAELGALREAHGVHSLADAALADEPVEPRC